MSTRRSARRGSISACATCRRSSRSSQTRAARGDDIRSARTLAAYQRARGPDIAARTLAVNGLNLSLIANLAPVDALRGLGLTALSAVRRLAAFCNARGRIAAAFGFAALVGRRLARGAARLARASGPRPPRGKTRAAAAPAPRPRSRLAGTSFITPGGGGDLARRRRFADGPRGPPGRRAPRNRRARTSPKRRSARPARNGGP